MAERKFIAIAGNIGAGKSSLLDFLTSTYDVLPFYEPNDANPYLPDFYRDMRRWAFPSQLFFLASKFRIHQQADRASGVAVRRERQADWRRSGYRGGRRGRCDADDSGRRRTWGHPGGHHHIDRRAGLASCYAARTAAGDDREGFYRG